MDKKDSNNWKEQKSKIKEMFLMLKGNDQLFEEEKKEEVIHKLQVKFGKSRDELILIISRL